MKALLANTSQQIAAVGRDVILGLVTELPPDKAFGILGESDPERLVYVDELVARARARGEVGPQPLPDAVRRAPLSLARYHAIVSGGLDAETIDEIVDVVFLPLVQAATR